MLLYQKKKTSTAWPTSLHTKRIQIDFGDHQHLYIKFLQTNYVELTRLVLRIWFKLLAEIMQVGEGIELPGCYYRCLANKWSVIFLNYYLELLSAMRRKKNGGNKKQMRKCSGQLEIQSRQNSVSRVKLLDWYDVKSYQMKKDQYLHLVLRSQCYS